MEVQPMPWRDSSPNKPGFFGSIKINFKRVGSWVSQNDIKAANEQTAEARVEAVEASDRLITDVRGAQVPLEHDPINEPAAIEANDDPNPVDKYYVVEGKQHKQLPPKNFIPHNQGTWYRIMHPLRHRKQMKQSLKDLDDPKLRYQYEERDKLAKTQQELGMLPRAGVYRSNQGNAGLHVEQLGAKSEVRGASIVNQDQDRLEDRTPSTILPGQPHMETPTVYERLTTAENQSSPAVSQGHGITEIPSPLTLPRGESSAEYLPLAEVYQRQASTENQPSSAAVQENAITEHPSPSTVPQAQNSAEHQPPAALHQRPANTEIQQATDVQKSGSAAQATSSQGPSSDQEQCSKAIGPHPMQSFAQSTYMRDIQTRSDTTPWIQGGRVDSST